MNVLLPLQHHRYAFWLVLGVSLLLSVVVATALRRKRWL
jgi:Mg2+ and Co2+ transporter CorA